MQTRYGMITPHCVRHVTRWTHWFILKRAFTIDGRLCPPGTMLYHPDPHFEGVFHTESGGEILIVQYPGPSTGERPIYAGRFNMDKRKSLAEERVDL